MPIPPAIVPNDYRKRLHREALREETQKMRMELEAKYAASLMQASWWKRFQIRSQIHREISAYFRKRLKEAQKSGELYHV